MHIDLPLPLSKPRLNRSGKLIVLGKRNKGSEEKISIQKRIQVFFLVLKKAQKRTRSPVFEVDDSAQCFEARDAGKR